MSHKLLDLKPFNPAKIANGLMTPDDVDDLFDILLPELSTNEGVKALMLVQAAWTRFGAKKMANYRASVEAGKAGPAPVVEEPTEVEDILAAEKAVEPPVPPPAPLTEAQIAENFAKLKGVKLRGPLDGMYDRPKPGPVQMSSYQELLGKTIPKHEDVGPYRTDGKHPADHDEK